MDPLVLHQACRTLHLCLRSTSVLHRRDPPHHRLCGRITHIPALFSIYRTSPAPLHYIHIFTEMRVLVVLLPDSDQVWTGTFTGKPSHSGRTPLFQSSKATQRLGLLVNFRCNYLGSRSCPRRRRPHRDHVGLFEARTSEPRRCRPKLFANRDGGTQL